MKHECYMHNFKRELCSTTKDGANSVEWIMFSREIMSPTNQTLHEGWQVGKFGVQRELNARRFPNGYMCMYDDQPPFTETDAHEPTKNELRLFKMKCMAKGGSE